MYRALYLIRPLNLLLVCLSQLIFYYLVIVPSVSNGLRLNNGLLLAFIFCTVLITAAGYLINDYFDFDNDKLNKNKLQYQNKNTLLKLYYIISVIGFLVALVISYSLGNVYLVLIYLLASLLLFLYSSHLKSTILWGNILVSVFSAMVFLILIIGELPALELLYKSDLTQFNKINILMLNFGLFAFCISMVREIVKDIEDMEGDRSVGISTLPITWGIERAKIMAAFFGITLVVVLFAWFYSIGGLEAGLSFGLIFIITLIMPCIFLIYKCLSSQNTSEFRKLSQLSRIIMFLGLIFLILYAWN